MVICDRDHPPIIFILFPLPNLAKRLSEPGGSIWVFCVFK
jgi:hypothetical protein